MTPDKSFGPSYSVLNLSKLGLRYFRFMLTVRPEIRDELIEKLKNHPNVGWIFSAEGWFNLAVGLWVTNNAEILEISNAIRGMLGAGDVIVYQSELTSLYGFANRPYEQDTNALPIIDAMYSPIELSPLELDYIKLITMDNSHSGDEFASLLGITALEVEKLHAGLVEKNVILATQQRLNHTGVYYKVFVDTLSASSREASSQLLQRLWNDQSCIYVERAVAKYDLEFEIILPEGVDIGDYLKDFAEYQIAILKENLYTNLYPLNKVANLTEIKSAFDNQSGDVVDLRSSKLWYLNYLGTEAYLNIYENKAYFEVMEQGEIDLFTDLATYFGGHKDTVSYTVIDIGSGDGLKGRVFIERLGERRVKAYYPIDIQPIELAAALRSHQEGGYSKHPTLLSFEKLGTRFPLQLLPQEHQIFAFFGGTYGNFPAATINSYLKPLVSPASTLVISMPIVAQTRSEDEIISSYTNKTVEDMAFGPLAQIGFDRDMFENSPLNKELKIHIKIEDDRLVTSFVLNRHVALAGHSFAKGTIFKVTTSWKPTLEQFKSALELDFHIDQIFHNESMAIAIVSSK